MRIRGITAGRRLRSYIQAQSNWDAGMRPSPSSPDILAANLDIVAEGSRLQPGVMGLYTMPDSPITTVAQLKGRTVGNNAPKNLTYMVAASVLADHGISPGGVHFVVAKGGFPQMPAELKARAFNAAVLNEPFGSVAALSDGAVMLADFDQGATTNFPVEGYVVTKQWAQKYPRTLAAFYKALEQGQQLLIQLAGVTVASSRMQVTPSRVLSASRTPGSAPCRATTCAHACRRAVFTSAVIRLSARVPPHAISASVRHAVGTDATSPDSSR